MVATGFGLVTRGLLFTVANVNYIITKNNILSIFAPIELAFALKILDNC